MQKNEGYTVSSHKGYTAGEKYTEVLSLVKNEKATGNRLVTFENKNDVQFRWVTKATTKAYRELSMQGIYTFTVDHILAENMGDMPRIRVRNLKRWEQA